MFDSYRFMKVSSSNYPSYQVLPQRKLIFLCTLFLSVATLPNTAPASELCDFSGLADDSKVVYTYDEIKDCFESVTFRQQDLDEFYLSTKIGFETSPLADLFNQRHSWRSRLEALNDNGPYLNDYTWQNEATSFYKQGFRNPHWRYIRPACYQEYVRATIPLVTNSMIYRGKQIVYVEPRESRDGYNQLYNEATGIDLTQFYGQRIVKINGKPALDFYHEFGNTPLTFNLDENDGSNFSFNLSVGLFERSGSRRVVLPPNRGFDIEFATKKGKRTQVYLSFIFVDSQLGSSFERSTPIVSNQAEFQTLCYETKDERNRREDMAVATGKNVGIATRLRWIERHYPELKIEAVPQILEDEDEREEGKKYKAREFAEVPEKFRNKFIRELTEDRDYALGLEFKDDTTVLRLRSFVPELNGGVEPFLHSLATEPIIQTTNYACENSERLILDMRNNGGGFVLFETWLLNHLFPESDSRRNYLFRGDHLGENDVNDRQRFFLEHAITLANRAALSILDQTGVLDFLGIPLQDYPISLANSVNIGLPFTPLPTISRGRQLGAIYLSATEF